MTMPTRPQPIGMVGAKVLVRRLDGTIVTSTSQRLALPVRQPRLPPETIGPDP